MTQRPRRTNGQSSGAAVAYLRVSTTEQQESGLGLESQAASIEAAAKRCRLQVRATFTDAGLSGALPIDKRPELAAALACLQRGDTLIVAKRDRIARDLMTTAAVERAAGLKGARILSAAGEGTDRDDPDAVLMRMMVDAFGVYERLMIKARTAAALRAKRARGHRSGTLPYGWRLNTAGTRGTHGQPIELEPNHDEREMVLLIAELRQQGQRWREIASTLNELQYRNRAGRPWTLFNARSAWQTFTRHRQDAASA